MAGQLQPTARARRLFWVLVLVAALASGALSTALTADPGPATAAAVAVSGATLALSLTLATRILLALDHARRATKPTRLRRVPHGGAARAIRTREPGQRSP